MLAQHGAVLVAFWRFLVGDGPLPPRFDPLNGVVKVAKALLESGRPAREVRALLGRRPGLAELWPRPAARAAVLSYAVGEAARLWRTDPFRAANRGR